MRNEIRQALRLLTLGVFLPAGCAEAPPAIEQVTLAEPTAEWALPTAPAVSIGVEDGDARYLLHEVTSVIRLANGNVVLLDAGSSEMRFFDANGVHIRTVGRGGDGPGEFRRPSRIYLTHTDSMLVFDAGTGLESRFDSAGVFVRAEPWTPPEGEVFGRDAWLYKTALVDGPSSPAEREPMRVFLDRLPDAAAGEFRFAKLDEYGRVWVRREPHNPDAPSTWHVYALAGEPLARVTTPARFDIQHIGVDYVAGRGWDTLGVERAVIWPVSGSAGAAAQAGMAADRISGVAAQSGVQREAAPEHVLESMRGLLRSAMTQQEIFYSTPVNGFRYAWRADQLEWPEDMQGVTIHITTSGPLGYTMLAFHENTDVACGIAMGVGGPLGWQPGIVACN